LNRRNRPGLPGRESNGAVALSRITNDWNALYREIAKANGRPEWEQDIRDTFAQRNVANLDRGWWYQDRGGAWVQKP
jgi:uncharacterized protein YdbL (DUF1318 family)